MTRVKNSPKSGRPRHKSPPYHFTPGVLLPLKNVTKKKKAVSDLRNAALNQALSSTSIARPTPAPFVDRIASEYDPEFDHHSPMQVDIDLLHSEIDDMLNTSHNEIRSRAGQAEIPIVPGHLLQTPPSSPRALVASPPTSPQARLLQEKFRDMSYAQLLETDKKLAQSLKDLVSA